MGWWSFKPLKTWIYSSLLLLGSHWTRSSPCSWSPGCSRRSGTSAGWSSPASPQRQSSFLTCRSWNQRGDDITTLCDHRRHIRKNKNHTPVHVGGLEPLGTGELHHHLGLLDGIRLIWERKQRLGCLTQVLSCFGSSLFDSQQDYTTTTLQIFTKLGRGKVHQPRKNSLSLLQIQTSFSLSLTMQD